jgi:UDP-N-acetylmuramate dehydrogenase
MSASDTLLSQPLRNLQGAGFTTYRIGGPLDEAWQPATAEEAAEILRQAREDGKPVTVLGWGGNSIIASRGIRGVTLITRKLDQVERLSDTRFRFGAGVHLARASSTALKHGLSGGEYMIGIPGTIGGAIRMNAGALGQETAGVVRRVTLFSLETGALETREAAELGFSYRKSAIRPEREIVLSAELEFQPGDPAEISDKMERSVRFRKEHHPREPNGGSVFKNPAPEMPVGRLMDELGAKGQWCEGAMMVSPLHGNFIINTGGGTSLDTLRLMRRMQHAIRERYGLDTHPENLFVGDATPEERDLWQALTEDSNVSPF